jgi:hypothetical protein
MPVDAGRRKDRGQAVQELQGGETKRAATGGIGLGKQVENLVRAAADQMEPFESEGRPGTIPNQPFQPLPVGSLDADAGVQAEAATVIPAEHVLGVVGFQEAVSDRAPREAWSTEDPLSDRVLKALQESAGEGCGFVEAEAGFWIGRILDRVTLNLLEETIHDDEMKVKMRIEA